jgi:hypothetical protein
VQARWRFDAGSKVRKTHVTRLGSNAEGAVPIYGTDPAARQDAFTRVPAFLGRYLLN